MMAGRVVLGRGLIVGVWAAAALLLALPAAAQEKDNNAGPYVPTAWVIVDEMLKLADITRDDTVYDLGSGDGRLVITAAKRYGARGVGIEIQPDLVEQANRQAKQDGLADRVNFRAADLFESDFREASVITLYLLPRFVTRLVPKFRAELKPGSRIVSHDYPLAPWVPDKVLTFDVEEKERVSGTTRTVLYYYLVPARVGGRWEVTLPASLLGTGVSLSINQEADSLSGFAHLGTETHPLRDFVVKGEAVRFALFARGKFLNFTGTVADGVITGLIDVQGGGREIWSARRSAAAR